MAVTTTGSRTTTSPDGMAGLVLAPGDRHHPHRAGEGGNVEADFCRAVGADGDDAGIEGERRLDRRASLQCAFAAVAAGADLALGALHAVDQLAVEVADFGRELALPEIIVVGVWRLVIGEIEDADIDRRDDDARLLARARGPASLTGTRSVVSGRISAGRSSATPIVCAALSMLNHCTPMARPGMRFSASSSGRLSVAST